MFRSRNKKHKLFIFATLVLVSVPAFGQIPESQKNDNAASQSIPQVPSDYRARLTELANAYASEPLANADGSVRRRRPAQADLDRYQALQARAYEVLAPLAAAAEANTAPSFDLSDVQNLVRIFAGQFRADPGPEAGDHFGEIYKQNKASFTAELNRVAKSTREAAAMIRYLDQYLASVANGNG